MRNGIFISPIVVRILVGLVALGIVSAVALQAPEIARYVKSETM